MAGQGIERREALRYIAIASVAATFPGFSQWTFACSDHVHGAALASAAAQPYKPLFFSPAHFRLIEHLAEMIIPADETPGAKEAGVAEFTDGSPQMRTDDIEQWIACSARQCQQRYLLANDIPSRALSLLNDAFRNQDAQYAMRRRTSKLHLRRNLGESQAGFAGSRQNAQHRHCSLNALRSARQIKGGCVRPNRTAMATSYHETRLEQ